MRKRAIAQGIIASTTILIIGWQTGVAELSSTAAGRVPPSATATAPAPAKLAETAPATSSSPAPQAPTMVAQTNAAAPAQAVAPSGHPALPPAAITPTRASAPATTGKGGTFTGSVVNTQYGPVQVQITVASSRITEVTALQLTNQGRRSIQISNRAAPILRSEVLSSQNANVASVSGATYTSAGYLGSLQSALDLAGLK